MVESCKQQQVRIEEEVLQKVDRFVKERREKCEHQDCNPWLLCLNKVLCWVVWVTVKIAEWVLVIVVRWVYRTVCVLVSLAVGIFALIFTFNADTILRAFQDLWELFKDAVFLAVGFVLFYANNAIDYILTALGLKDKSRKLTRKEISILRTIYGDSILYDLIKINEGRLGIMGPPFATGGATTIGYNIYLRSGSIVTLVHECVHVWQFQFGGTHYIGQSAVLQVTHKFGGDDPYDWFNKIGTDTNAWYLLESVEAQAEFVEDMFQFGKFIFDDGTIDNSDAASPGAFFRDRDSGHNEFTYGLDPSGTEITAIASGAIDFTTIGNAAWKILKIG
jgi:hypothetical protein